MKKVFLLILAAASMMMTSCDEDVAVTGVLLNPASLTIGIGDMATLTALVEPGNATHKAVRWSSDKPDIVTVNEKGEVTAVAKGVATITVVTNDGEYTETCIVTVVDKITPVTSVKLNKESLTLTVGQNETLTATVMPGNAMDKTVTWSSDNESVATVNNNGGITAVGAGTAVISATSINGIKGTCTITVTGVESSLSELERQVINLVNHERSKEGKRELQIDESLLESCDIRAEELPILFSHTRPDGSSCFSVIKTVHSAAGENIARGDASAEAVMSGWMNSQGHRNNILSENYTHIGVGHYNHEGTSYWVQLFIRR